MCDPHVRLQGVTLVRVRFVCSDTGLTIFLISFDDLQLYIFMVKGELIYYYGFLEHNPLYCNL